MKRMNNNQINNLNDLLINHGETLTAFYDETIDVGIRKGLIIGSLTSLIFCSIGLFGVLKFNSSKDKD